MVQERTEGLALHQHQQAVRMKTKVARHRKTSSSKFKVRVKDNFERISPGGQFPSSHIEANVNPWKMSYTLPLLAQLWSDGFSHHGANPRKNRIRMGQNKLQIMTNLSTGYERSEQGKGLIG